MNLRPILGDMVAYFYNSLVVHLPDHRRWGEGDSF